MSLKEQFRSIVRAACQEYITTCRSELSDTLDSSLEHVLEDTGTEIYTVERPTGGLHGEHQSVFTTSEMVIQPSKLLVEIPDSIVEDAFESVAGQLSEAVDYTLDQALLSDYSGDQDEIIQSQFQASLAEFAGEVMDYTGEIAYDDEAFEVAYDQQFFPGYTDREVYEAVIPVSGSYIEEEIELSDVPQLSTQYEGPYEIEQLCIEPLTPKLDSGVRTYHAQGRGHSRFTDSPADVVIRVRVSRRRPYQEIRTGVESNPIPPLDPRDVSVFPNDLASWYIHDHIVRELVDTFKRTYHLWNPRIEPGFENGYLLAPNWLDYRESVANIIDEFYVETGQTQGTITFTADGEPFSDFWNRYAGYLTDRGSFIEKPVTRMETMFERETPEDAILDALIALEGSLLQGTSGSSYTFRLKLRSRLLLENLQYHDWAAEETGDIAAELYALRGRLIHHDDDIEEAIEKEDLEQLADLSGYEVVVRARTLLANIVLAFLDQDERYGLRPGTVTKAIDHAALAASYDPDRAQERWQSSEADESG